MVRRIMKLIFGCVLLVGATGPCAKAVAESPSLNYVKRDTAEATRRATMAQYEPTVQWDSWMIAGPFDNPKRNAHDVVYPPELGFDAQGRYEGKGGQTVTWKRATFHEWDPIDLKQVGDDENQFRGVAYLYREAQCEADGAVQFNVGSDDGLKFWFNGQLIIDADAYRGLSLDDHLITLNLHKGRNTLLAKVTQDEGDWQFQMLPIIDHRLVAMLEYRLSLDLPEPGEASHYRILSFVEPKSVVLEVGGLTTMPDGRPILTTRRGEVWIVEGAYAEPPFDATFKRFASGLHEPLGAAWRDGGLWVAQRGELTKLVDLDGDDRADLFQTLCNQWGVSGNYHEFAFGPRFDGQGRTWVTLNLGFCGGLGKSIVPWRGWAVIINADGSITPVCGGLRSPCGLGANAAGDMFYTDNQGDWVGTCKLSHLAPGDWHGHPGSNRWYEQAGFRTPTSESDFKPPAIWFPYGPMGQSASDIVLDQTGGKFGPFDDQLLVGDQTISAVMRVDLEKVEGVYQGACFMLRRGFDCGITRMCFGNDGSLFVGETNRGWGSVGRRPWGLQRLVYTGRLPFEIQHMRARPDGFELVFTKAVDPRTAGDSASYSMSSYTWNRWEKYGSPQIDTAQPNIKTVAVAADGMSARLTIDGLRAGHVHELHCPGVRSAEGEPLLHEDAYYTLNVIPGPETR